MNNAKLVFIHSEYVPLLKELPADATGKWGKMNPQQMVEHVTDFFKVSGKKISIALVTPVDQLPQYKEFLLSDKEFRENTKAPGNIVPEEPGPVQKPSMHEALEELQSEINDFVKCFEKDPQLKVLHPVFGELSFDEWVLLHHKHITHHLRQFGLL